VRDRRTGENPLAHLEGGNVKLDRRHDRQTLTAEQLAAILAAAAASKKVFRGLGGRDRHALYLCAMGTGFRAGELASLLPEWFTLNADPPTVALPAREDRAGRFVTQPLPSAIAEALLEYLKGRPAGQPVWPGTWVEKAAEMLRLDLEAAGIPYVVEGPDGPLYADFHALRHSYIALLDKSGATLKEAMHLARHSDPKLTMAVYGRSRLHDLGRRAEKLSDLLLPGEGSRVSALVATGTDGHLPPDDSSAFPVAFTSREASSTPVKPVGGKGLVEEDSPGNEQPLAVQGVEKPCIPLRAIEEAPRA
jgi:integrase/recombinase XerC